MKTTIEMPDDLFRKVKAVAALEKSVKAGKPSWMRSMPCVNNGVADGY
ncbi:MAG: hypothetical protein HYX63_10640 [Gammaproteobacteria bacterium]|nr:hypothetical protein [Gammaproteobacteria bacterium]